MFTRKRRTQPLAELQQLISLLRTPRETSGGFVIEFIGADDGDGTSTVARDFALLAAQELDLAVVLLDLNWPDNPQFHFFAASNVMRTWYLNAQGLLLAAENSDDPSLLPATTQIAFHQVGESTLVVSEAHSDLAQHTYYPGSGADFWRALRGSVDIVVIDAPAAHRSLSGVMVAPEADAVVLVIAAEDTLMDEAMMLRNRILLQGGRPAGIVFNRYRLPSFFQGGA